MEHLLHDYLEVPVLKPARFSPASSSYAHMTTTNK